MNFAVFSVVFKNFRRFLRYSFTIFAVFSITFAQFSYGKTKSLVEADLKGVQFGLRASSPLKNWVSFSKYDVEAHLIKLIILDSVEAETNVVFKSAEKNAALSGVIGYRLTPEIKVGGVLDSDFKKKIEHKMFLEYEKTLPKLKDASLAVKGILNTKRKKFDSIAVILSLQSYSIGVGFSNPDSLVFLARVSLF